MKLLIHAGVLDKHLALTVLPHDPQLTVRIRDPMVILAVCGVEYPAWQTLEEFAAEFLDRRKRKALIALTNWMDRAITIGVSDTAALPSLDAEAPEIPHKEILENLEVDLWDVGTAFLWHVHEEHGMHMRRLPPKRFGKSVVVRTVPPHQLL